MRTLRLALGQVNSTVGDLAGNVERIGCAIEKARRAGVDLIAFPELAVTGYPPEDLLLKPGFLRDAQVSLDDLAKSCTNIVAVVGFVDANVDDSNPAAVLGNGNLAGGYHKR